MANFFDPVKTPDWKIAQAAEKKMKKIYELRDELGLKQAEVYPYGHFVGKLDYKSILSRFEDQPLGKYVNVTAITPTPLGEGKSTTTIGLLEGLGKIGKRPIGAIRQPSGGPTFNIKGSAAGGGLSQCVPLTEFSLGLTGDIDAITNAHNLAMVALTSRIQHEFNYTDSVLEKKKIKRLDIDPRNVTIGWAMDFSAQALREIIIGLGDRMNGFMMKSGFQISVSSEIMAILAISTDLKDFRNRIGKMIVAYDKKANPITTHDLEVDGAMTALLSKVIYPNLIQTLEGQPVLVHAGPFANIALGQSSVIADYIGLKLGEYHVTESGFGADIGFEKFWNLKCRYSGLEPDCSVLVATVRALKMHGGGPKVVPGKTLDEAYTKKNMHLVEKGLKNLCAHIDIIKRSGIQPVVCINYFHTDDDEEIDLIKRSAEAMGVRVAVAKHWLKGGEGAVELAEAVVDACEDKHRFKYLYDDNISLNSKIELIAKEIYGATGVKYTDAAVKKLDTIQGHPEFKYFGACMAKTHLSLSHDPSWKGKPKGWILPVNDILLYRGAGLAVPVAGDVKLMPGTASDPAYRNIDVDIRTGLVTGLF
ncbi:MAG: formate--tetrahydrofolate ligase [Cyclobacteriaceae bacterium]|nr:formate--tetrahydrofolate ligase [Cyclobacteriaceae bacterium]